jgi:hypothetical protein
MIRLRSGAQVSEWRPLTRVVTCLTAPVAISTVQM